MNSVQLYRQDRLICLQYIKTAFTFVFTISSGLVMNGCKVANTGSVSLNKSADNNINKCLDNTTLVRALQTNLEKLDASASSSLADLSDADLTELQNADPSTNVQAKGFQLAMQFADLSAGSQICQSPTNSLPEVSTSNQNSMSLATDIKILPPGSKVTVAITDKMSFYSQTPYSMGEAQTTIQKWLGGRNFFVYSFDLSHPVHDPNRSHVWNYSVLTKGDGSPILPAGKYNGTWVCENGFADAALRTYSSILSTCQIKFNDGNKFWQIEWRDRGDLDLNLPNDVLPYKDYFTVTAN